MYAVKLKQVSETYLVRTSGKERRRAMSPYRHTIARPSKWRNRHRAEKFMAEIRQYWEERWRLNGEKPFDLDAVYEIVEVEEEKV